ncbi:hypothetical protein EIP91_007631 [Steccherinum ochraceum]|uniref:Uncharacterized protein n=1 Tax=Steccherinum ochraceum TaxID=92696 RepID=A0A4R0R408_9APHY|nr:hypothetical protein EIP91_007631 [Steccherinum ochraceum]
MLSRSAKAAAQGRALLSPLSPLPSSQAHGYATFASAAQLALDNQRRTQRAKAIKKKGRVPSKLEISAPTPTVVSPTTAAAMGFDTSIMERLQDVLASPFSPKTFARSILSPALKTPTHAAPVSAYRPPVTQVAKGEVKRVGLLKPRRKPPPSMLNLPEPPRYTEKTPLSPFRYPGLAAKAALNPMSPTKLITHVSPVTTLTEAQIRLQKMEKLSRCLGEAVPKELVYPSFGQLAEQTDKVGSFLELYRGDSSVDDSSVGLKSPVPKDAHWEDVALGETKVRRSGSQRSLRRSRSLGDFYSVADIRELQSNNAELAAQREPAFVESPTALTSEDAAPTHRVEAEAAIKRKRSIANAKQAIIGADAKLMAQFRLAVGTPALPMFPPTSPLSPSIPSALLDIQSPVAPYWVRPNDPKTPRTRRTERRMGWGGPWNVGSMGEMMTQLKEL